MSEKPKWTPGPHTVIDHVDEANHGRRVVAGGRVVAQCECLDPETNHANATLFGEAENLYEGLESVQWVVYENPDWGRDEFCPKCRNEKRNGHHEDCSIAATLALARGEAL